MVYYECSYNILVTENLIGVNNVPNGYIPLESIHINTASYTSIPLPEPTTKYEATYYIKFKNSSARTTHGFNVGSSCHWGVQNGFYYYEGQTSGTSGEMDKIYWIHTNDSNRPKLYKNGELIQTCYYGSQAFSRYNVGLGLNSYGLNSRDSCEFDLCYLEVVIDDNIECKLYPAINPNGDVVLYDKITGTDFLSKTNSPLIQGNRLQTSFNQGDVLKCLDTYNVYKYNNSKFEFYYKARPSLVFKGITFEMVNTYKVPDLVFRGFSFEITDKVGGSSMFHGMN